MNQINELSLSKLQNGEHVQFMTDVYALVNKHDPVVLKIDDLLPDFQQALEREHDVFIVESGSSKTKLVNDLDLLRDRTWSAISDKVKAYLQSPFEDEAESARLVMRVIDIYGNVRDLSLNKETALITDLLIDLQKPEIAPLTVGMGLTNWISELQNENNAIQEVLSDRNTEYASRESGDSKLIRMETDVVYKQIVNKVNALFTLNMAVSADELFAEELNMKIKTYQTSMAMRIGKKKPVEEEK